MTLDALDEMAAGILAPGAVSHGFEATLAHAVLALTARVRELEHGRNHPYGGIDGCDRCHHDGSCRCAACLATERAAFTTGAES